MRILLAAALLGVAASCAWAPPETAAPPVPAVAAAPTPLATPVALAPAPTPVAAPPPPAVEYVPVPVLWLRGLYAPPPAGRLMLSNFSFETARVQAVLASGPDCAIRQVAAVADFVVPPNGTRIIPAPPGADICWRRELAPAVAREASPAPPWTEWNRAFTGPGRSLDAIL